MDSYINLYPEIYIQKHIFKKDISKNIPNTRHKAYSPNG